VGQPVRSRGKKAQKSYDNGWIARKSLGGTMQLRYDGNHEWRIRICTTSSCCTIPVYMGIDNARPNQSDSTLPTYLNWQIQR
jgi:hypothetical protein